MPSVVVPHDYARWQIASHSASARSAGVRSFVRSVFLGQALAKTSLTHSLSCSLVRSVFLGQALAKTSLTHSPLVGRLHFLLGQALAKKCRLPPRSRLSLSGTMAGYLPACIISPSFCWHIHPCHTVHINDRQLVTHKYSLNSIN